MGIKRNYRPSTYAYGRRLTISYTIYGILLICCAILLFFMLLPKFNNISTTTSIQQTSIKLTILDKAYGYDLDGKRISSLRCSVSNGGIVVLETYDNCENLNLGEFLDCIQTRYSVTYKDMQLYNKCTYTTFLTCRGDNVDYTQEMKDISDKFIVEESKHIKQIIWLKFVCLLFVLVIAILLYIRVVVRINMRKREKDIFYGGYTNDM